LSTFNSSSNWLQGLQGLFGSAQQQNRGATGQDNATNSPFVNYRGMPTLGPGRDSPQFGYNNPNVVGELRANTLFRSGAQPGAMGNMTYGQAMGGALARDYQNAENARQRELGMYQGLFGNIMGSMAGGGQMVQDARRSGEQNMAGLNQQAGNIRQAADQGKGFYDDAVKQMMSGLSEARGRFDQGIGTLQTARSTYDSTRRDDVAGEVFGIQSQYKNQLDSIGRRDDLTPEQKDMMTGELKQSMRQQSSALAAQADAKARDTLLALDQNISQMQSSAGAQLGQFGIGIGQTMGQLGAQVAAQKQQAEEQIGNFYNNMAQFNSSLLQSAQANALQHTLNGNQLAASLVSQMPFGPMSIFETLTRMVSAGDYRRNQQVSPEMGALFGRMA
jgi:GH24 family phage-related lysozyme (muramidase)